MPMPCRFPHQMSSTVRSRYNEVCQPGYTFGSESGSSGTGHFTQVVWKGSQKLGMGKADGEKNGMKCTYIVGRYDPAGNMMGAYADNVPKGSFDQSYCSSVSQKRSGDVSKSTTAIGADPQWLPRVNIPKEQWTLCQVFADYCSFYFQLLVYYCATVYLTFPISETTRFAPVLNRSFRGKSAASRSSIYVTSVVSRTALWFSIDHTFPVLIPITKIKNDQLWFLSYARMKSNH